MPGIYLLDIAGPCDVFAAADKILDGKGGYEILLALNQYQKDPYQK